MARDKAREAALGSRLRTGYLLQQAGYTEKVARAEAATLAPFGIGKETLAELAALRARVLDTSGDRTGARASARSATAAQDAAAAKARLWLRSAILIGQNAYEGERAVLGKFTEGRPVGRSVPRIQGRMRTVLALLGRDPKKSAPWGATPAFLKQGDSLLAALSAADATQEIARAALRPATHDFHLLKAELFRLVKRVHRAAHAAWVNDRTAKRRYRFEILRRGGRKRGKKERRAL